MTPIQYKGYTIEEETDPWALNHGMKFRYYCDEVIRGASSIVEAKWDIDQLTEEETV
jgi:hypothetical protein